MITLKDIDFKEFDIAEDRLTLIKTGIRDLLQEALVTAQRAERERCAGIVRSYKNNGIDLPENPHDFNHCIEAAAREMEDGKL